MNPRAEQQRLFDLLSQQGQCFVRLCGDDSALWVSDLPRRANCDGLVEKLRNEGFEVRIADGLLYADWTEKNRQKYLSALPTELPALPLRPELHEAYALCRLLLLHPSEEKNRHMPMLRQMVKLTLRQPSDLFRAVRRMHEETAVSIRNGHAAASDAGRVLADWLQHYADEREEQP